MRGLKDAIAANLPGAAWQCCRTHYAVNLISLTPKSMWPAVKAMLPAVAEHLETARADILAFTDFPKDVWTQLWSNNPNERLNRDTITRLVGGVLAEQTDEWTEGRRYLGLDILAKSRLTLVTDTDTDTGTGTEATEPELALTA